MLLYIAILAAGVVLGIIAGIGLACWTVGSDIPDNEPHRLDDLRRRAMHHQANHRRN